MGILNSFKNWRTQVLEKKIQKAISYIEEYRPESISVQEEIIMGNDYSITVSASGIEKFVEDVYFLSKESEADLMTLMPKVKEVLTSLPHKITGDWLYNGDMFVGTTEKDYLPHKQLKAILGNYN